MTVTLEEVRPAPPPPPVSSAAVEPPPQPPVRAAPPKKRFLTARPRTPRAAPPVPAAPPPKPEPAPPAPPKPAVDMLAMINARRERRRAEEAAAEGAALALPGAQLPAQDAGAVALKRNLESLTGDDRTGGIFEILEKSTYSAEFAFNGWRPDTGRRWREVIEVRAHPGEDIDLAIVRRMIKLIRTHYSGEFLWESRRLGRVVTLSASPADNQALEDFLVREFFGAPILKPADR